MAAATVELARTLPPEALDESVDGEWSFLETLRHLVMATDRWILGAVLGDPDPYHRLGRPNDPVDPDDAARFDLDARPTLDEVLAVRRGRMDQVAELLRTIDETELHRQVPSPYGPPTTVLACIQTVLREEWWHDRYANRDLAVLRDR